jgi:hypothetical protein
MGLGVGGSDERISSRAGGSGRSDDTASYNASYDAYDTNTSFNASHSSPSYGGHC